MINFATLSRTYLIAEAGVNHEGSLEKALELVDLAAQAGADAVKFQTFEPARYVSTVQPERRERVGRFALSREAFRAVAARAQERGVAFISTPLYMHDADFLEPLVPFYKISSGDLTFLHLIRHVAAKKKPMVISTGLGTREEIQRAVDAVLGVWPQAPEQGALALMHCVSAYPTPDAEANLANMDWLRETFGLPVGYSDHTLGIKACELAVAMGALVIEKHFTDSRAGKTFHDHALSAEPAELAAMRDAMTQAETLRGRRERQRGPSETAMLPLMRRSLAAAVDIPAGQPVTQDMLTYLRPAWGLALEEETLLLGRRLRRAVPAGDLIRREDLDE